MVSAGLGENCYDRTVMSHTKLGGQASDQDSNSGPGRKHAIAGFLAGYSGTTLEAYRLDLRGWITWLDAAFLDPFAVERAHIELYARWSESEGKARSTIGRRLSTICGFYKYALDLYIGERESGPIFMNHDGTSRLDRHASARIVRRLTKAAGIEKRISPHSLRHSFITAALDAGVPLRDVQEAASHSDPRTTMRYDRGRGSLDRHATYIVSTFVAGASR